MGAGGKAGGGTGAHDYYGTIPGLVCAGPVDALLGIVADGKTVWPEAEAGEWVDGTDYDAGDTVHWAGRAWSCAEDHLADDLTAPGMPSAPWDEVALRRGDPGVGNPVAVAVPRYGTAVLYWGTPDQQHGPDTPAEISADHPPYRRQCWIILKDWLFGRERTSAPNVEFLVRRAPQQGLITGPAAVLDPDGQANPVATAAELLSDPVFGFGAPELADEPAWQTAADALQERPDLWHLSPVLPESQTFQAVAETLGQYAPIVDHVTGEGRIALEVLPRFEEPPFLGPDMTVDGAVLMEPVSIETDGQPVAEVSVTYSDRARAFKDRTQKATDTLSRGEDHGDPVTMDRPWITRAGQAAFAAADHLRRSGQPGVSGKAVILRDRVPWLRRGSLFLLADPRTGLRILCRCLSTSDAKPPSGARTIAWEAEDAFTPLPTLEASTGGIPDASPDPETVTLFRLVQPPPALVGQEANAVVALVARTSRVTTGIRVWFQEADASLFTNLGNQTGFAIKATLQATYSSTPGTGNPPDDNSEDFRLTVDPATVPSDLDLLSETQSADAINDARVLVWVFKASGEFEVMTMKAARVATGETFWRLKVRRARFGTARLSFASGDVAFVVRRDAVVPYTHQQFGAYSMTGAPALFRLQARNPWRQAELSDAAACPDRSFTFGDGFAPVGTWTRIEYRPPAGAWGDVASFSGDFDPAGTWRLSARISDPNADLMGHILRSVGPAGGEIGSGAASGAVQDIQREFALGEGDWEIVLRVLDRAGRGRNYALAPVGGGASVVVKSRPAGSTVVANPVASPRGGDVFGAQSVTLTCSTSGATQEFQVVALGAPAGGSWTTYSTPVSVNPDSTLYVRATKAGMTDSPTVRHDYRWLDPETV